MDTSFSRHCTPISSTGVCHPFYYVNSHIVDTLLKGCRHSIFSFNHGRLSDPPYSYMFPSITANGSTKHQEVKQGHRHTMYRIPKSRRQGLRSGQILGRTKQGCYNDGRVINDKDEDSLSKTRSFVCVCCFECIS